MTPAEFQGQRSLDAQASAASGFPSEFPSEGANLGQIWGTGAVVTFGRADHQSFVRGLLNSKQTAAVRFLLQSPVESLAGSSNQLQSLDLVVNVLLLIGVSERFRVRKKVRPAVQIYPSSARRRFRCPTISDNFD